MGLVLSAYYPHVNTRPNKEAEPSRWNNDSGSGRDENGYADERQAADGDTEKFQRFQGEGD